MCTKKKDGTVIIEVPNKQVRDFYQELKVKVPSSLNLKEFKADTLKLKANVSKILSDLRFYFCVYRRISILIILCPLISVGFSSS